MKNGLLQGAAALGTFTGFVGVCTKDPLLAGVAAALFIALAWHQSATKEITA